MITDERVVRIFRNGSNQALRIPREFEIDAEQAILKRDGKRLIIEPVPRLDLIALLLTLSPIEDEFPDIDSDLLVLDDVNL